MSRRKLRKKAHQLIVKEGLSHQQVFDDLRTECDFGLEKFAEDLSKFPSKARIEKTKNLRYVFIASLVLVSLLRIAGIFVLIQEMNLPFGFFIFGLLIALFVPVIGILAAILHHVNNYNGVAILMALGIFRGFTRGEIEFDMLTILLLIPFIVGIILAIYIPTQLKTSYKKTTSTIEKEGKKFKKTDYQFEEESPALWSDDLLDS